jgi:hypothetical protein
LTKRELMAPVVRSWVRASAEAGNPALVFFFGPRLAGVARRSGRRPRVLGRRRFQRLGRDERRADDAQAAKWTVIGQRRSKTRQDPFDVFSWYRIRVV